MLVVCKSLLGKAHTVMAEGGVAAAMHNVAYQDSWEVHFADTMKGGKLINDWRMAELHAKESPERVLELERWGAVFDRTWQGRIHQRPFGAHTYPRLEFSHMGISTWKGQFNKTSGSITLDRAARTGSAEIRVDTSSIDFGLPAMKDFAIGADWLDPGGWGAAPLQVRGSSARRNRQMYRVTSNSWGSTGTARRLHTSGCRLRDMEMVSSSHRDGLACKCAASFHRGRAWRGRCPAQ